MYLYEKAFDHLDPYEVLKIKKGASKETIRKAFKRMAKKWHPDKNKSKKATLMMKKINWAYQVLKDGTWDDEDDDWEAPEPGNWDHNTGWTDTYDANTHQRVGVMFVWPNNIEATRIIFDFDSMRIWNRMEDGYVIVEYYGVRLKMKEWEDDRFDVKARLAYDSIGGYLNFSVQNIYGEIGETEIVSEQEYWFDHKKFRFVKSN